LPEGHADVKLVLEPNAFEAAREYQKALYTLGVPSKKR
jgi:hypothetical protein